MVYLFWKYLGKEKAINNLFKSLDKDNISILESTVMSQTISEFIKNKDKIPKAFKHRTTKNFDEASWENMPEIIDVNTNGMDFTKIIKFTIENNEENLIPLVRPKTPYIKDTKGNKYPLGLYAMGK